MKNTIKIIIVAFGLSLISCGAVTDSYSYNDSYSQGYSDGYRDGYYQSPDGYWYAPNAIYLDNNGSYYRNGKIYKYRQRTRNNVIISPRRNDSPMRNPPVRNQIPQTPRRENPVRNTPEIRTNPDNRQNTPREIRPQESDQNRR